MKSKGEPTDAPRGDFIRDVAAQVAVALAGTPQGRAAGLSIEVWPGRDVSLRVRMGHQLRVFVAQVEGATSVRWNTIGPRSAQAREGSLGELPDVGATRVQALMADWVASCLRG